MKLELKETKKEKALVDFGYFFEEILLYERKLSTAHNDIVDLLNRIDKAIKEKEGMEELLMMPRGTGKSTVFTIAGINWLLTKYPDLRILISNASLSNAEKFLDEIKRNFKKQSYIEVFGDVEGDVWRNGEIRMKNCTRTSKEMSIIIGSPSTSLVSQHFDIQIMDDLVNRESTNTYEQMEKTKQYWKDLIPLGQGVKTIRVGIGTRWNFADLYSWLIDDKGIKNTVRSIYADDKRMIPFYPEEFPLEAIDKLKKDLGGYDFAMHYLNNPIDDENAKFKTEWMKNKYEEKDLIDKNLTTFALLDFAQSKNEDADFTGCAVIGIDKLHNWYVLYIKNCKFNITERIELIFDLWKNFKKYNVAAIGVEQKAFEDSIKPLLKVQMEQRGVFPNVIELKDAGRKKEDRILGLVPRFEYGKVLFKKDAQDDTNVLIDQLMRFPKSKHDDLMDALAYANDMKLTAVSESSKDLQEKHSISESDYDDYGEYGLS